MKSTVSARRLWSPKGFVDYPLLTLDDGVIVSIESLPAPEAAGFQATYPFSEGTLVPSFLDVHVHGGAGHDVMEGTSEAMEMVGRHLARHGVGAYLPTTVTAPVDDTLRALSRLAHEIAQPAHQERRTAIPLGIHLEGPFLSHAKRGVHTAALLQPASTQLFDRFWEAAEGRILLLTVAPEMPGAVELIAHVTALGVRCSLGHSDANLAQAQAAQAAGACTATHTFNAMRALDHREPGLTGFVLSEDTMYAEIIVDGIHVDPLMVRLFSRTKKADRVLLVSDGMSATGMPDGEYKLGDLDVRVAGGRCTSGGALAGSVLTLDRAIRNYMQFTGASLHTAVQAASSNPARLLGFYDAWGELAAGRQASFNVVSADGELLQSFMGSSAG